MTTTTKAPKNKVYQIITDRIIAKVTAGEPLPWAKPWKPGEAPHNIDGRGYTGLNVFMLDMEKEAKGYKSNTWLTFKQATERGGDVTGEKTTPVLKVLSGVDKKDPNKKYFKLMYFNVFNADQVKNLTLPQRRPAPIINPIDAAEKIINTMPNRPQIDTNRGERACYYPQSDKLSMPPMQSFKSAEHYYKVLFHELTHSTAHPRRVNRDTGSHKFGSADYSKEELIAEMGAAFLMGLTGIATEETEKHSAAYIQGWLTALRNDPTLLVKAASAAQKAADYISSGHSEEEEPTDD